MGKWANAWTALTAPQGKAVDMSALVRAPSSSGVMVSETTALKSSAVYACVRLLTDSVATLPVHLYRINREGHREKATGQTVNRLIRKSPNVRMTGYEFWRYMMLQAVVWNGAYAEIIRGPSREISQLIPLPARAVQAIERADYTLEFKVTDYRGQTRILHQDNILRFSGLSVDGITGVFPIEIAREAIGLALAAERHAAVLFRNGGRPIGVLELPGKMSPEISKDFRESWQAAYSGNNAQRTAILEHGLKYVPIAQTNKDSQNLESRQFEVRDIARFFSVQPHLIGDLSDATFSNIEAQGREFVTYTLAPWLRNIEDSISRDLLGNSDNLFAKFNVDALLRGNTKDRADFYQSGIQSGWLTRNEAREKENRNPLPGLDEPLEPLNMANPNDRGDDENGKS